MGFHQEKYGDFRFFKNGIFIHKNGEKHGRNHGKKIGDLSEVATTLVDYGVDGEFQWEYNELMG